jgi:hypothetical protein
MGKVNKRSQVLDPIVPPHLWEEMIGGIEDIGHLYQTPQKDTIIIERIREDLRFWRLTMSRKIMLKKKIPFLLGKRNLPVMQLSQHPYQTMKLSRLKHDVAALHPPL